MRAQFLTIAMLATLATPAFAQMAPSPLVKTFTSSAEVQQLIAKAKADRKGDAPTTSEPILSLAPYRANLEYRPIAGPAAVHDTEDEVMYVIEGAGTITLGGQMVNPTRPNPTNLIGRLDQRRQRPESRQGRFPDRPARHAAPDHRGRRSGTGADDPAYAAIAWRRPSSCSGRRIWWRWRWLPCFRCRQRFHARQPRPRPRACAGAWRRCCWVNGWRFIWCSGRGAGWIGTTACRSASAIGRKAR